jgi:aspartyl-tRNA(Asn)/glutamyl-tRNA(Gln) amidotransferase subunit B
VSERTVASFRVLVGMEVHVQLATRSKMFTAAPNGATHFGAEPNSLVDEQVLGLPGTLPVMNRRAVEYAMRVGLALGCTIARHTKWDRKSYYYPDLPKNYQISQYDLPLCHDGALELETGEPASAGGGTTRVRIRRAHLEEDAGKLLHEAPGGYPIDWTIVDLNRAGTPLLEIVTEPDLTSARHVALFGQELQRIVQYLGVSEGQMQMGHMRFEPNINVHITDGAGQVHKTAITEIKNLNSFSSLERATDYEIRRQIDQWVETGSLGKKSTFGWDESHGATFLQREKEEAHDYRYFPDPDLVPVEVDDAWLDEVKSQVGELPAARRRRYVDVLGLSPVDASVMTSDRTTGEFFEQVVRLGVPPKRACNLLEALSETMPESHRRSDRVSRVHRGVSPQGVAEVAALVERNVIAANKDTAQAIFKQMADTKSSAEAAANTLGLAQVSDAGAIDAAIEQLLATNPKPLQDYRAGKQAAFGALVGMVMKNAKGLNPRTVQDRLKQKLQ